MSEEKYSFRYFVENWLRVVNHEGKLVQPVLDKNYLDILDAAIELKVDPFLIVRSRKGHLVINPKIVKYLKSKEDAKKKNP